MSPLRYGRKRSTVPSDIQYCTYCTVPYCRLLHCVMRVNSSSITSSKPLFSSAVCIRLLFPQPNGVSTLDPGTRKITRFPQVLVFTTEGFVYRGAFPRRHWIGWTKYSELSVSADCLPCFFPACLHITPQGLVRKPPSAHATPHPSLFHFWLGHDQLKAG